MLGTKLESSGCHAEQFTLYPVGNGETGKAAGLSGNSMIRNSRALTVLAFSLSKAAVQAHRKCAEVSGQRGFMLHLS